MYNSRKYILNENYFKKIQVQEQAYLLGLLLSDGYLYEKEYKVGLTSIDKSLILFLKDNLQATNPIAERQFKVGNLCYEISLNSKILFYDVLKYRQHILKKEVLHIPNEIPKEFMHHFIRGYFDADGCIRLKNNKKQLNFDIASYENILKEIAFYIDTNINKKKKTKILPHGNIHRINYAGNIQCYKIYKYLYQNAHLYLQRKKDIFENMFAKRQMVNY